MFAGNAVAYYLDLSAAERRPLALMGGHYKTTFADERDWHGYGFDLNPAVAPTHVKRHSGLQAGLAADSLRDDQATCRVYGRFHVIKSTTSYCLCDPLVLTQSQRTKIVNAKASGSSTDREEGQDGIMPPERHELRPLASRLPQGRRFEC